MGNFEKNNNTISSAFARMFADKSASIENALTTILEAGVSIALDLHDTFHQNHIENGDSYGYAIWHDGELSKVKIWSETESANSVRSALTSFGAPSSTGWCGIVMAGMNPAEYYKFDYEIDILNTTVSQIEQDFGKYFTRI